MFPLLSGTANLQISVQQGDTELPEATVTIAGVIAATPGPGTCAGTSEATLWDAARMGKQWPDETA